VVGLIALAVRLLYLWQIRSAPFFDLRMGDGEAYHQWAGRMIWEGMNAAANASFFPDQLTGEHPLNTWQVKKIFSGGSTAGTGGTTASADCTTGFTPAATNNDTVAGVWTGYESPYAWPPGNVQGRPAGSKLAESQSRSLTGGSTDAR